MIHYKKIAVDEEPTYEVWKYSINVGDDYLEYQEQKEADSFEALIADIPKKDINELNYILLNGEKETYTAEYVIESFKRYRMGEYLLEHYYYFN